MPDSEGPLPETSSAAAATMEPPGSPGDGRGCGKDGLMHVYLINEAGLKECDPDQLDALVADHDGVLWVDMPICAQAEAHVLSGIFGFHELAVGDCLSRNHVSKVYVYEDHAFTVLHAPKIGKRGHVHYIELDQFLGRDYLVTVHGPLNPIVDPAAAFADTGAVLDRLTSGEFLPRTAFELCSAIVATLAGREIGLIADLAERSGQLEQRVMSGESMADSEAFLTDLFQVWYELLAIRTMAAHSAATYDRMAHLAHFLPPQEIPLVADLADRFEVVSRMADGQRELLHGIIEFFQTRISMHMTIAADRMAKTSVQQNDDMRKITAWVAIVAVPAGVTGFFGQNVPYPGFGQRSGFIASALIMVALAATLYLAFKRKRWL
jgi:magnesium transporter